ncbi:hypothetical protein [Arthrobacter sp. JSM 101049]|uniref:hypothetical protein n=1 Tax=Arthrobacter sp. JSM 101049 TaxID=929097 RepID=UPI00356A5994
MRTPSPEQAAFRRGALIWAPLAAVGAVVWLATYPLANGATVLGFLLLMGAAVGVVLDDGQGERRAGA